MPHVQAPRSTSATRPAVHARFADRPTLRSVVAQRLASSLQEKYPPLTLPVDQLRLATPRDGGGHALKPVLEVALHYVAKGDFPDLSPKNNLDCYLSDATGTRLTYETTSVNTYDLNVIEAVIRELRWLITIDFQDALAQFWGQPGEPATSRWSWLSGLLQDNLRDATIRHSNNDEIQLRRLTTLADSPDRQDRRALPWPDNGVHAYTLESQITWAGHSVSVQACDILVVAAERVWLYRLSGEIEPYASLDDFGKAWCERLQQRYLADTITWRQYEPDGSIFDNQAALVLNQQLEDLAEVTLPAQYTVAQLEQRFADITAPSLLFDETPPERPIGLIEPRLPQWLKDASPADRFAYRQCLLEQASFRKLANGDSYLSGLDRLEDFAAKALDKQLCLRYVKAHESQSSTLSRICAEGGNSSPYKARELQLNFKVPVGDLGSGYLESIDMSLIDLALKNLSGKPKGTMTVTHSGGQVLEDWLTPQYLSELVQQVDIGKTYPHYIREHLMGESLEAQRRERLFIQQQPILLVTQALEHKILGQHGLTARGLQFVKAVVKPVRAQRWVQSDEIVMRPLAFQRKPNATADVVQNMFIIEARNVERGPHLLYRPSYKDSLLQFETRAALLAAIALPGAVQDSVLTWLSDGARPIYSNGGFLEPHYVRIGMGSEFGMLPDVPKPATLAAPDDSTGGELLQSLSTGNLMQFLFGSEVRTLLDQAEHGSTSNTESRWALILEGLQLGLNTLLAVARGPIAIVGWMMQLAMGLKQDIPALESDDSTARELAWIDLLLNVAMLLLHMGQNAEPPRQDRSEAARELALTPLRRKPSSPFSRLPMIKRGTVGLVSEPPGAGKTLLDFDRSFSDDRAVARAMENMMKASVPWPVPLPEPISFGEFQGLYKIGTQWHASIGGLLFRVNIVPGFGEVFIIHPQKTEHPGIKLKAIGQGRWVLDRGIRLVGGGHGRVEAQRRKNAERTQELVAEMQNLSGQIEPLMPPLKSAKARMADIYKDLKSQVRRLNVVWKLLSGATPTQHADLIARHALEMQKTHSTRTQFKILLETFEERCSQSQLLRERLFKVGVELEKAGGAKAHVQDRPKMLQTLWDERMFNQLCLLRWAENLQYSDSGEPMSALAERMVIERAVGNNASYDEHLARSLELKQTMQRLADVSSAMERLLEQLENDSGAGREVRRKLLEEIERPQYFFAENLKLKLIQPLSWLCVDTTNIFLPPQEALYVERLDRLRLSEILNSHVEVRSSNEYPLNEQRDVYETAIKKYRQYENAMQSLNSIRSDSVKPVYAEEFLARLQAARALAENELESVVRRQEQLEVELPMSKTLRPKAPAKRVFKTRHQDSLIGVFKPRDAQHPIDRMVINDSLNDATITSFDSSPEGWQEAGENEPVDNQPSIPADETFAELKNRGNALLRERRAITDLIHIQQRTLANPLTREQINPGDWDLLLTTQAQKIILVADTIDQRFPARPAPEKRSDQLRAEARDMLRQAKEVCSAAYKQQLPTMEGLAYLWRQREIDINLTSTADPERPTLRGDFFTEYAVYDKAQKPPTVLWYAHFHYASADAAPAAYTRAHLKLPEQRKYTQKDLLKQHVQAELRQAAEPGIEPLGKIVYVLITPPQDQLFLTIAPAPRE